jgi:dihydrofolate reductase
VKLILIAALTRRRVIGKDGKLPWHLSDDLKRFKQLTTGHTVLMGRKTYESIGKPLPNRRNVVLSSRPIPGAETYDSLERALDAVATDTQVFVIGGGTLYAETIEMADALRLTIVETDVDGDTFFPEYEKLLGKRFKLAKREQGQGCWFEDYEKI